MTSLAWGSACSGSDIMAIAFEDIVNYSKDNFNKDLEFLHMFSCEKDKRRRAFLARVWSFPLLIPNTIHLAKSKVTNLLEGGLEVWFPWVYLYAAGFSCVSLSTLTPNSSQNRGSVRDEREKWGVSFGQVFAFVPLLRPFIVILENLEKLLEVKDGNSDAAYCVGKFEKAGYCARWFRLSARDGGSLCARVRLYLVGYKGENQEHRLDFVEQTLQDMQVKASKIGIHLEHFTTTDFDTLIEDEDPGEEKIVALQLWDEDPDTAGQAEEEPLQWCV